MIVWKSGLFLHSRRLARLAVIAGTHWEILWDTQAGLPDKFFHVSHLSLQHDLSVRLWINHFIYIYVHIHMYIYIYIYIHTLYTCITTSHRNVTMHMMVKFPGKYPRMAFQLRPIYLLWNPHESSWIVSLMGTGTWWAQKCSDHHYPTIVFTKN